MDTDLIFNRDSNRLTDREKVKFKKQLFIYLFFLVISFIFWYINALSHTYITELSYQITYTNYPKGKVLVSDKPASLILKVRGNGFQLLRSKVDSHFRPIEVDLKEYASFIYSINSGKYSHYLSSLRIKDKLNKRFPELQLIQVKPDSLYFNFTTVIDRKVAVKPQLIIEFSDQYMLSGKIQVIPDSIIVSGPKVIIDTLSFIYTKKLQLKDISDTIFQPIELEPLDKFIFPRKSVKVYVPVEKFTEVVYSVPVEPENVPAGFEVKTFPASITVSFNVTLSVFDQMTPYMFRAAVDYKAIVDGSPQKLKVNLVKYPSAVTNVKFYPKSVEYLVEKW